MKSKRIICLLLSGLLLCCAVPFHAAAQEALFEPAPGQLDWSVTRPTNEIVVRDPCVLVYGQTYFLYGTGLAQGGGYGCYVSRDMENWAGPVDVFRPDADFDGVKDFWAPECHYYNGYFYLFATYYSKTTNHRGVSVFRSDSPLGPFEEISDGHITPKDWDAIDGTLYVDADGQPWMVFVHEWTSMPDGIGDFSAAKLSADLSQFISEPFTMFRAGEMPLHPGNTVTDGCWLTHNSKGELLMLWSGSGPNGYCVAVARSSDGTLAGDWQQNSRLLYTKKLLSGVDGGHGMLFTALDGTQYLSIHAPNGASVGLPRPVFLPVSEASDGSLILQEDLETRQFFGKLFDGVLYFLFLLFSFLNLR